MAMFGQSEEIEVRKNKEIEGTFTLEEVQYIGKKDKRCMEENDYSFTRCIRKFVETSSNCSIDWFSDNDDDVVRYMVNEYSVFP